MECTSFIPCYLIYYHFNYQNPGLENMSKIWKAEVNSIHYYLEIIIVRCNQGSKQKCWQIPAFVLALLFSVSNSSWLPAVLTVIVEFTCKPGGCFLHAINIEISEHWVKQIALHNGNRLHLIS